MPVTESTKFIKKMYCWHGGHRCLAVVLRGYRAGSFKKFILKKKEVWRRSGRTYELRRPPPTTRSRLCPPLKIYSALVITRLHSPNKPSLFTPPPLISRLLKKCRSSSKKRSKTSSSAKAHSSPIYCLKSTHRPKAKR